MESASGMVSAVRGAVVIIDVMAPVACQRCAEGRGCGAGLLGADEGPRQISLKAPRGMTLRAGDRVRLAIAPRQLLRAAWLAYGLPLLGLVSSVGIAFAVGVTDELTAVIIGLAGIVAGMLAGRYLLRADSLCGGLMPVIEGGDHDR